MFSPPALCCRDRASRTLVLSRFCFHQSQSTRSSGAPCNRQLQPSASCNCPRNRPFLLPSKGLNCQALTQYCSASQAAESPPGALAPSQRALARPQDRFSCTPATPAPALPHQRQPLRLIVRRRPSFAPLTSSLILTHAPPHPASFVTSAGASLSATPLRSHE